MLINTIIIMTAITEGVTSEEDITGTRIAAPTCFVGYFAVPFATMMRVSAVYASSVAYAVSAAAWIITELLRLDVM